MRTKKEYPILENILITDAASEGRSIFKTDEMVIFVEGAVPGDIVDVKIFKKKKNYAEGKAIRIIKESDKRDVPFCEHFGTCGGCKWQHLQYEWQLFYKEKQVYDALTRLGKVELHEKNPIIGSDKTKFYRNKLEYTFSNKRWLEASEIDNKNDENFQHNALGYHIPGRFDKVLDIKNCYLQPEPSNSIRLAVKKFALENNLSFFDLREQTGFLRNLIIRNTSTGELMVIVCFHYEDEDLRTNLLDHLNAEFPSITSLLYVINPKRNDTIFDLEVKHYKGKEFITEKMGDLSFKISPKSFFQTNTEQAITLYNITRDFAGLKGNEVVYDLYTGTGTIANYVASKAKKVVGIEYIESAIADAKENSKFNNITNTAFFAGDIKDTLNNDFISTHGKPDIIITDPPRAGMHEDVVRKILEIGPEKVVYVSCNPATQARDLAILDEKYIVSKVQPVDMFPHTYHVENVVLLTLRLS